MKGTRNILTGLFLGAIIGWVFGFLRLPYVEKNSSFIVGFISCLAFVALVSSLIISWKKNTQLLQLSKTESSVKNPNTAFRTFKIIWILIPSIILIGVLLGSYYIYRQNENLVIKNKKQNKKLREQAELIESSRTSSLQVLLNDVLKKVDYDLMNNPYGKLSDETIAGIIDAFNFTFIPYRYFVGDSLSIKKLSPEKGQLLLELFRRNIDSISFNKIKLKADFSGADLSKRDLHGVNLSNTNLKNADFSGADLSGANFQGSDLRNTNLWGVKANQSRFDKADMRRTVLCWAMMNDAHLYSANLNGADLTNAQLMKSDLHKATFRAAILDGALLNNSNMVSVELIDASLKKSNLTKVNLTKADVNRANFNEAIMTEAELNKISLNIDNSWFEKLDEWHIAGSTGIQKNYKIVVDTILPEFTRYCLEKR